jgi:maltose-binding protein MalE
MSAHKTVCRVTDAEQQQAETCRYWHSMPVGDRFSAVWDISAAAFAFAAAFKGNHTNDAQGSERAITRIQQTIQETSQPWRQRDLAN